MEPGRKIFSGEIGIENGRIVSIIEEQGKDRAAREDGKLPGGTGAPAAGMRRSMRAGIWSCRAFKKRAYPIHR